MTNPQPYNIDDAIGMFMADDFGRPINYNDLREMINQGDLLGLGIYRTRRAIVNALNDQHSHYDLPANQAAENTESLRELLWIFDRKFSTSDVDGQSIDTDPSDNTLRVEDIPRVEGGFGIVPR